MRSIEYARAKGREAREEIGASPVDLFARLEAHLRDVYGVDPVPMRGGLLTGSKAEIDTQAQVLEYDPRLADEEILMLVAHELGHLVLHQRLRDPEPRPDPLLASAYGDAGPSATARYSPRTYEETQAAAFALELVAPSDAVWNAWLGDGDATAAQLAAHFGCGTDVIHTQLAHALHSSALGGTVPSASRKDVPFTAAQLAAARFVGAPAIIDAGPGTGKTATVIRRIQFLLEECGAQPSDILALTFSNEAAQELLERIGVAFGDDAADAISVRTFHGFGVEFVHLHGHLVGIGERFELLDEDRQAELVYALLGEVPCDQLIDWRVPMETATRVVEHINFCKQRLHGVDVLDRASQFAGLFRAYEARKQRADQMDFADLIALPIRILEQNDTVREAYAKRFPWVIVDEFQDVTRATSRLLRALCGPSNPPWAVGDARQSIYQFLGAAPENVSAFTKDFAGARVFELGVNYRSAQPVVTAANQLAALLENSEDHRQHDWLVDMLRARWTPGTTTAVMGDVPVAIAEAASDAAEAEGVATRVGDWIARENVLPGEIAVLCRRHVDVRNVILELSKRGIKAQASGVLTAEGAAGDLAAMLTLGDAPAASVPRVVFALGRGRRTTAQLNATIGRLLRELRGDGSASLTEESDDDVAFEMKELYETLNQDRDCADGFSTLATVLFDHGAYLRRILALPDSAEPQMALVEIVSVLSLATAYRATHRGTLPAAARVGFAERLRIRLTKTLPVPLAPRPRTDAVHVMTCHASKGLEFPCVVVVGQTLPEIQDKFEWLPAAIRPERSREESQANALLFVGVTRAKRAVVVSFPRRARAGTRRGGKVVVPLLERWREVFGVSTAEWNTEAVSDDRVSAGNIWGLPLQDEVKASALDDSVCPLLSYLETYAGARFPEGRRELYPSFFNGVRRSLRVVVERSVEAGAVVGFDEARAILESEWPAERVADHAHGALYRAAAERMVVGFARAFGLMVGEGGSSLEPELVLESNDGLDVRLDLIAHYRRGDGSVVAIVFRPESLASGDESSLNWSDLAEAKRSSLALLEHVRPGVTAYVYSGKDERIYEYRWSKSKKSLPTLAAGLEARRGALARGDFSTEVARYQCDRCRVRASCPQWIGALNDA